MKNQKKYKPPKKKQPFFSFVKSILRLFYKKPKIINLAGEIKSPSIIISNHCYMKGPIIHELYLPVVNAKWGAGEMLGNYKMRFKYLRNTYFIQKKGYSKSAATIAAAFDALFSKFFYRGMKVISTWKDGRILNTFSNSVATLNDGTSILIFPENSENGYKEVLTEFYAGFVALAEFYYRKTKVQLPIYPVYYYEKNNEMIIGEPHYVQDYIKQGLNRKQIAEKFRKIVNGLYTKHIRKEYVSDVVSEEGTEMYMTTCEIVRSYKYAENKVRQIRILAELNLCSKEKIKAILRENGVEIPCSNNCKKAAVKK